MHSSSHANSLNKELLTEIRHFILSARQTVARMVDSGLVLLYWNIGNRIQKEILQKKRAAYGKQIVSALGRELEKEFGRGFSEKTLRHMIRFAEAFPDMTIVSALGRQLGWTHFRMIIYLDDPMKRTFYSEMCRLENWNTRTLQKKIDSMLFERTALSKKPTALVQRELHSLRNEDLVTPELIFRDPYILDFLGLKDIFAEKDLETAILREIENFILELGVGFTFVSRQKRMTVDNEEYHLDLLFYHRHLHRLVAIELKLGDFKPAYKSQMELYLAWLDRYERNKNEEKPIGLILCAGKKEETIELLNLEKEGIHVSSYWTESLPKKELQQKLHEAIARARAQLILRSSMQDL
ncbi:MAG: PDDEXK nuclease domain-containing protein [Chthoniobacterales bacterium]